MSTTPSGSMALLVPCRRGPDRSKHVSVFSIAAGGVEGWLFVPH